MLQFVKFPGWNSRSDSGQSELAKYLDGADRLRVELESAWSAFNEAVTPYEVDLAIARLNYIEQRAATLLRGAREAGI